MIKLKRKDEKGDTKQLNLTADKLAISNMITIEALLEILSRKGILTKEEVLEEVRRLGREGLQAQNGAE